MPDFGADRRYRELVRLSYLVLPGGRANDVRLALARGIVDRALPRRPVGGSAYADARRTVLRRSIRPSWKLRWRLRGTPAKAPDNPELAALRPDERVAYVLCRVLGMRRYEARDVLVDLAVPDAQAVLDRVARMPELNVVTPGPVGARGVRRRSRAPLAVALLVTCAAAGALAVEEQGGLPMASGAKHVPEVFVSPAKAVTATPKERILWEGTLPGQGGEGRLLCRASTGPQGVVRYEGLLTVGGHAHKARECADGRTALWWRAPNKHWYFLAAGDGVTLHGAHERAGLHFVRGERTKRAPLRAFTLD
ncbi:hypothetical protein [Actinocorallia sp. A-T 12471]|uniref:hypothetical protein n=1 Tax=Actinocorallia sp. A-T 12471 TaxID=3089813 RepID=UPI0029D3FCE0|nr:hypothetical protein [Actinocorallia sp. A-T 12471]MDX6739400.1 hypothetical protein [Actinocorallia sp. A-T 12471]